MSLKFKYLSEIQATEANFILKNFLPIPKSAVTLLSASGGTGKTRLSLIMADRHIQETSEVVALWLTEDYPGQVRATFDELVRNNLAKASSLSKMMLIINEPPQLAKRVQGIFKANYEEINKIGETLILNNVGFAVFDPLLAFYGGNENDNSEARVFIQTFAEWAKKADITSLIIHHANANGGSRGATAFHDGVRARYELDVPRDDDDKAIESLTKDGFRVAKLKKDNWGIRKYLWRLTDGADEITLKVMPRMIPVTETEYKAPTYSENMEAVAI